MTPSQPRTLLLLSETSESAFHELRTDLVAAGLRPVIQHYPWAMVLVDAGAGLERFRKDRRIGAIVTRCIPEDALTGFPREVHEIAQTWNHSLSPSYRKREGEDPALEGLSWGAVAGGRACGFQTLVPPEVLESRLLRHLGIDDRQRRIWVDEYADRVLPREDEMRRILTPHYGPRLTQKLVDAANALSPYFFFEIASRLPEKILQVLKDAFSTGRLEGLVAVGVIIVDPKEALPFLGMAPFSGEERQTIKQKIQDGLAWLAKREPQANLAWCYDWHEIAVDTALPPEAILGAGCSENSGALEFYWRDPALTKIEYFGQHFAGNVDGLYDYKVAMEERTKANYSFVVFVTSFPNCWLAYAKPVWVTLAAHVPPFSSQHKWGHKDFGAVDKILVHEVCHLFGAMDEYSGKGTPCTSCSPPKYDPLSIPNGNCEECARPPQTCIMNGNSPRLCAYTQGHLGWADLLVELETSGDKWAGTDDRVWLDIGDREFGLDNPDVNDRERGHVEAYALNYTGVVREEIKRIGLRKGPDGEGGPAGGWKPQHIRVWHRGELICDEEIGVWIEGAYRWWFSQAFVTDSDIVNHLYIDIRTGNDDAAGTADDVTMALGKGGPWLLDQMGYKAFNKGKITTFELDPGPGLYLSQIHSLEIWKAEDSVNGGWLLGGMAISANGKLIYMNDSIEKWLTGSDLAFIAQF